MTGKFPLQPLLDLANERMDEAARRLGELIASQRDGQQKLDMLQSYRDEYHARFVEAARNGIGPDAWRNYSAFIGKLDDAIAAQRRIVDQSRDRTVQGQEIWLAQRNRVKAFDTLSQRHQVGVARQEAKREQKQSDEHTARRYSGGNRDDN